MSTYKCLIQNIYMYIEYKDKSLIVLREMAKYKCTLRYHRSSENRHLIALIHSNKVTYIKESTII